MALWLERVGWSIPLTSEHRLPRASVSAECKSCRWAPKLAPQRTVATWVLVPAPTLDFVEWRNRACSQRRLYSSWRLCVARLSTGWSCVLRAGWTSGSVPSFSGSGNGRKLCLQELVRSWSVAPELGKSVPLKLPCQMRTLVKISLQLTCPEIELNVFRILGTSIRGIKMGNGWRDAVVGGEIQTG